VFVLSFFLLATHPLFLALPSPMAKAGGRSRRTGTFTLVAARFFFFLVRTRKDSRLAFPPSLPWPSGVRHVALLDGTAQSSRSASNPLSSRRGQRLAPLLQGFASVIH